MTEREFLGAPTFLAVAVPVELTDEKIEAVCTQVREWLIELAEDGANAHDNVRVIGESDDAIKAVQEALEDSIMRGVEKFVEKYCGDDQEAESTAAES